ncbi:MAG TPA: zinc-dependent alcohol dehydrogenase family protein [Candidatus Binatia bacterium]|nr:zinc-dependent alcohol dehydrogenase family protein [Candidatus Binatia bacterium]
MGEPLPSTYRAMVLTERRAPLRAELRSIPDPQGGDVLLRVAACAVCRTDLHVVDGELGRGSLPIVLGHQVVATVAGAGPQAALAIGDRVGVPWLGWACGACEWCRAGQENLCPRARFTGCDLDGGYAEYALADSRFCLRLPSTYADVEAAPLLCGGLIGYRALRMAGPARRLGFYGFGSAAHMIVQVARHRGAEVFAFTRAGDRPAQEFALRMGAAWAGDSTGPAPVPLDAAIIFAPAGELVPLALAAIRPGGVVVCAGIHMSDIPSFPYSLLWEERVVRSVANLTREDGVDFMRVAAEARIDVETEVLPLSEADTALQRLRAGQVRGTAVLVPGL